MGDSGGDFIISDFSSSILEQQERSPEEKAEENPLCTGCLKNVLLPGAGEFQVFKDDYLKANFCFH